MLVKYTSLILSFFILSQSFNLHLRDVLKLQNLIEHIEFHESAYGDDIFSFFSKHYGNKMEEHQEQRDDSSDHQKLPFHHKICLDSGHFFIFDTNIVKLELLVAPNVKKSVFTYDDLYSFLENTDIFQPPRIT